MQARVVYRHRHVWLIPKGAAALPGGRILSRLTTGCHDPSLDERVLHHARCGMIEGEARYRGHGTCPSSGGLIVMLKLVVKMPRPWKDVAADMRRVVGAGESAVRLPAAVSDFLSISRRRLSVVLMADSHRFRLRRRAPVPLTVVDVPADSRPRIYPHPRATGVLSLWYGAHHTSCFLCGDRMDVAAFAPYVLAADDAFSRVRKGEVVMLCRRCDILQEESTRRGSRRQPQDEVAPRGQGRRCSC